MTNERATKLINKLEDINADKVKCMFKDIEMKRAKDGSVLIFNDLKKEYEPLSILDAIEFKEEFESREDVAPFGYRFKVSLVEVKKDKALTEEQRKQMHEDLQKDLEEQKSTYTLQELQEVYAENAAAEIEGRNVWGMELNKPFTGNLVDFESYDVKNLQTALEFIGGYLTTPFGQCYEKHGVIYFDRYE